RRVDVMLFGEPRTFQANRDGTGIVIGSRATRHAIVMRPQKEVRSRFGPTGSNDDVVVGPLKNRRVAKAMEQYEQLIPGPDIGLSLNLIVSREREHLHIFAEFFRRHLLQHLDDCRVRFFRPALMGTYDEHDGYRFCSPRLMHRTTSCPSGWLGIGRQ